MIKSGPETGNDYFMLGSRNEITCNSIGDPAPKVIWEKNYMQINVTEHQGRLTITKNGSLIIYSAVASDYGTYGCIAQNELGSYFSERIYYYVRGKIELSKPSINSTIE